MEFEKLAVEVSAVRAGLVEIKPPTLSGRSGVQHRFSLLFSDGAKTYAFDFYERVTELQVIRSFAKKFDTGAFVGIVCLSGSTTDGAGALAGSYGMRVVGPEEIESFLTEQTAAPKESAPRSP